MLIALDFVQFNVRFFLFLRLKIWKKALLLDLKNTDTQTHDTRVMTTFFVFSALFYAAIFGNLTAIIQRLYSRTARYHRDIRVVKEFITLHKIPEYLQGRLREYFTLEQAATKGDDIESVGKSAHNTWHVVANGVPRLQRHVAGTKKKKQHALQGRWKRREDWVNDIQISLRTKSF